MKAFHFIAICALLIIFNACAPKVIPSTQVKDLVQLPQDALFYLEDSMLEDKADEPESKKALQKLKNDYLQKYYSPWQEKPNPNVNEVFWIKPSLIKAPGFGEHLQKNPLSYTEGILESMQIESYPKLNAKAIITTTTHVRAVPTLKPMFNKANGYPFDRWQNSLIFANTPVLITHISQDKAWVHIQSSFVYGWIQSAHVGIIEESQIKTLQALKDYATPIKDNIPLYNAQNDFVMYARIGQLFPIKHKDGTKLTLIYYSRLPNGKLKQELIYAPKEMFAPFPLKLNPQNIAHSINAMIGQRYGWGGLLENRDCSAFIRDIFTQYALHLPRNSKAQVQYGQNSIDLSKFDRKQKEAFIIANATPYQSILWQNGHIMLYLGHFQGRVIIAHSAWSVTSGKYYENMLGGVVITSLYAGGEHNGIFAKSPLLIDKIQAMSNLSNIANKIVESK